MKFFTVFAVLCLVAYSTQSPLFEGNCDEDIKELYNANSCAIVKCFSFRNQTHEYNDVSARDCGFPDCGPDQQIEVVSQGDAAAVYPRCCDKYACQ